MGIPLNSSSALKVKRDTQAPGLRVYGNYNNFDWDIDVMKQFGTVGVISRPIHTFGAPIIFQAHLEGMLKQNSMMH